MPGFIHGHRRRPKSSTNGFTLTYNSWRAMKQRCNNPAHERYPQYGGRGVTYDPRWELFEPFLMDMGERPFGTILSRKDHTLGYSAENCFWEEHRRGSGDHA